MEVGIPAADSSIWGTLAVPAGARGVVVFGHGSGGGRFGPRNGYVAGALAHAGLATLLMELLTGGEDAGERTTAHVGFDIPRLARRVVAAIDWLAAEALVGDIPEELRTLPVGCSGAGTGAAAALIAAAERPDRVAAVVCRGGGPDLARKALRRVTAPTLLVVGERDTEAIRLNRRAQARLGGESRLEIVPGAGHRFEEPGALERVAELSREWFLRHLGAVGPSAARRDGG